MAVDRATAIWEVVAGAGLVVLGAAFLREGWHLPDGYFEPMGPRPVPLALAGGIVAGAGAMAGMGAWNLLAGRAIANANPGYAPRPWAAALMLAATVVYAGALSLALLPYWLATAAFLTVTIALLGEFRRALWLPAGGIGLVMGIGLHLLFTKILVTDLP